MMTSIASTPCSRNSSHRLRLVIRSEHRFLVSVEPVAANAAPRAHNDLAPKAISTVANLDARQVHLYCD